MEEQLSSYTLVTDASRLANVAKALEGTEVVGVDVETTSLSPRDGRVRLLQLATPDETFVVDVFEVKDLAPLKAVLEGGPVKVLQNSKFDYSFLRDEYGISLSPIFDTMLAAQLLGGGDQGPSYSLEAIAKRHIDVVVDKSAQREDWGGRLSEAQIEYAARDAAVLLPLRERLTQELAEEKLVAVSEIEFRAVAAIAEMELTGIKLDIERWKELEKSVRRRRDEAASRLESFFPEPEGVLPLEGLGPRLNLNSPKQITDAFRSLGIELADTKVWTLLKVDHPAAKALLEYRELQKKLGTYLETYPSFIHPNTGRIHANFLQCRVPTGRLACASPNVQQIPHEDEFRSCFVAEQGSTLIIADYSQIELRILAEVSDDPEFVRAFREGDDLHRVTAATMFGVEIDEVTRDQRSAAKRINFGLMYGRGPKSLSAQLGTDEERARGLIDEYFANYPKVRRYLQGTASKAMKTRTLRTLSGRVRKFGDTSGLDSMTRGAMRREAMNYPIQGCVLGNVRIFERSAGYVPIRSLAGCAVSAWDGERFSQASVVYSGKKRLTRVVLKGGHGIECSPDHKFLVRNNNGGEAWKTAREIRAQERVVLAGGLPKWELSLPPAKPGRSWNANTADLNEIGTREELGEWLGRVASDGWVGERQVTLLVAEHEEVLLPKLLSLTERLGHVTRQTRITEHQPKRLHSLSLSCKSLAQQMKDMGIKERVPDVGWRSRSVLRGYLRGLFDGDGTAHPDGPVLTFGGGKRHLEWAREVQEALLLLGIRSRLGVYASRVNLRVMKKDVPLFCSEIGFMNPVKQEKTAAVVPSSYKGKAGSAAYGRAQKVESVEVADEWVEMYDVVDSETGRFAANGIVVHNSSADIAKLALAYIREELRDLDARLINSIHDEFVVECAEEVAPEVAQRTKSAMIRAGTQILEKVPVEVEVAISREWRK